MSKAELLKRIVALSKLIASLPDEKGNGKAKPKTRQASHVFKSGTKDEHGYGWGGNYRYTYKVNGKEVPRKVLDAFVKKAVPSEWRPGYDTHGFVPLRKEAAANGGRAKMKVGKFIIEAIG